MTMTALPPSITEAAIRAKATDKSYERGLDYHDSGMVESLTRRGNRLFPAVQGSECEPYRVGATIAAGDFAASCTCPYDWGGYCKHIVATLISYHNDEGGYIPVLTPVDDLLAGLDAAALRTLIHRLLDADPTLVDIVDAFCAPETGDGDADTNTV